MSGPVRIWVFVTYHLGCWLAESLSPYSEVVVPMASGKRPPHFMGHDKDGEAPGNNSKRRQSDSVPTQIGASYEHDINKGDKKLMENILEPMFRRAVRDEVTNVLRRHPHLQPSPSGQRQKTFQLRFKESPGESYTGVKVETKNGASLEVALYQCDEERIVTEGPLSSARVKLCLLQGNFGSDGRNDWSSEDFGRSTLNRTRKGGELLTGDLSLTLTNGVATVKDIFVHDISTWAKTQQFRLGVRVVETTPETENIKEGVSQPFRVKDCRGQGYRKHGTPSLNDEIWRLEDIAKGGKRHKWLSSIGIDTVGAFLRRFRTNRSQLKQGLKVGENVWKNLIHQAGKANAKQDARQPDLPTAPLNSEPQNLVQATGQGLPQHEPLPAAPQGLNVPSTSTPYLGEQDFDFLAEVLNNSSAHEGKCSCSNSGNTLVCCWSPGLFDCLSPSLGGLMITMDLLQKETFHEELIDNKKRCTDCRTTKTPLWRGGPSGPKTLCNACGIRYRKKRVSPVGLRLNRGQEKKRDKKQSRSGGRAVGNDGDDLEERLKMNLVALGEEVLLQRSHSAAKKQRWQRRRRELEEVEQAAFCLMALSCGLVFA
ncbi:hypothetical protein K1719_037061 [Acacia pycnantha]|nr:hypothetical protein K1719_037061 [Acacia pycnantha]